MSKTMDQHRAAWAWAQTKEVKANLRDDFGDYVSLAEGTSATLMMCGLGQTVAFYLAKSKSQHEHLLRNLASWLCEGGGYANPGLEGRRSRSGEDLLDDIMDNNRDRYHILTDEALDYLVWLKRFGKAVQGPDEQQPAQEDSRSA